MDLRANHGPHSLTTSERFWVKVEKTDTCWLWIAAVSGSGYGNFYIGKVDGRYVNVPAHRWAWQDSGRALIEGLELDHICRNRKCVNPDHLQQVTHRENVLLGISPWALRAQVTHCPAGHEYTEQNTVMDKGRRCRTCSNTRRAERKRRALTHTGE